MTMAKAEISFLAGDEGAVRAAQRLREEIDKAAEAGVQLGVKSTKAGKDTADSLGKTVGVVTEFVAGIGAAAAAFAGVKAVLDGVHERMERIKDLQAQFGKGAAGTQQALLPLAAQLGIQPEDAAAITAAGVAKSGAGASVFSEVARTVDSLFGKAGNKQRLAEIIAATTARVGGDATMGNQLAELMTKIPGATDSPEALQRTLAGIEAASTSTGFSSVGELAQASGKGALGILLKGGSIREALARQGQARAVTSTRDEAAELMRQLITFADSDAAKGILTGAGSDPSKMTFEARFGRLAAILGGGSQADFDTVTAGVTGEQRSRLERYFRAPAAQDAYTATGAAFDKANVGDFTKRNTEFLRTTVAQTAMIEAGAELREAGLDRYTATKGALHAAAKKRLEINRAMGQVGYFDDVMQSESDQIMTTMDQIQAENLGFAPPEVGGSWSANFSLKNRKLLDAERSRRGLPRGAVFGAGGESFMPPVIHNHYGDNYHLNQQDVTRPPEPEVIYQ